MIYKDTEPVEIYMELVGHTIRFARQESLDWAIGSAVVVDQDGTPAALDAYYWGEDERMTVQLTLANGTVYQGADVIRVMQSAGDIWQLVA